MMKKSILLLFIFSFGLLLSPAVMAEDADFAPATVSDADGDEVDDAELAEAEEVIEDEEDEVEALEKELSERRQALAEKRAALKTLREKWKTLSGEDKRELLGDIREKRKEIWTDRKSNFKERVDEKKEAKQDRASSFKDRVNDRRTSFQDRMAELRAKRQKTSGNDTANDTANVRGKTARFSRNIEKLNDKTKSRYSTYRSNNSDRATSTNSRYSRFRDLLKQRRGDNLGSSGEDSGADTAPSQE